MTNSQSLLVDGRVDLGSSLNHVYCCDPDLALCGLDLADVPDAWDPTVPTCVVCDDIDGAEVPCGPTCTASDQGDESS
jgi:hypothetical protein